VGEGNIIEGMATTWETIEERERRVRGTRTTSALIRAGEQIPGGDNLTAAFAARPFISRAELRHIGREHADGPVISLYLNFSGERLVRDHPLFLTVFDSLRHGELEARKPYIESLPHAQRLRVPEDLADVRAFLEGFEPQGARAIVIFKQGAGLNRVMALPVRVADSLTIDLDPYIQPLEAILEEQRRVLVVEISKERTAVSAYELGYEEPIGAIKAFAPDESVDASQPDNVQRHRLTHRQWHLKASAQLADRLFREQGADGIALIGEERIVNEFEEYLPKALQQRLVARLRLAPDASPDQRRAALEGALADERKREEEVALGELGFYQGHGRLAAGLELVIDAANLFLMRQLFLDDRLARGGYVCRNHHFLSLTAGPCPFDNQPLLPAENVIDELVEIARLHGVQVMLVTHRQDLLGPFDRIAAVLVTATSVDQLRAVSVTSDG
jgi:Bacterial archaeo-eukaryotic release factor family 10